MKIKITPELLAELKEKAEKATPGLWICIEAHYAKEMYSVYSNLAMSELYKFGTSAIATSGKDGTYGIENKQNAEYIASANPAVIMALVKHIERLEKEADWLAEHVAVLCGQMSSCVICEYGNGAYCSIDKRLGDDSEMWREAAHTAIQYAEAQNEQD